MKVTLTIIVSILKLGLLILGEYYAAKKRKREANEAYELSIEEFERLAKEAMIQFRLQIGADSQQAGRMDDVMDDYIRNSNSEHSKEE